MPTEETPNPAPETPAAETPAAEKPAEAAAASEKTFEQEVAELAGVIAAGGEPEPEKPAEDKPAGEEKPASEEPAKEEESPEKPEGKPEEEKKPTGDLARRLAMVADGHRKLELRTKDLDTREGKLKPLEQLADKLRAAGANRVAVVRELLGGDDQFREFYVEATDEINDGPSDGGAAKPARKSGEKALSMEDVGRLVREGVKAALEEHGKTELEQSKAGYVAFALQTLEASPDAYPLTFAAPPTERAITDISEALRLSSRNNEVPSVETVLKRIEDHRRARHEKATKKADPTKPPEKPAAAAARPSKTSGENPKPTIRGNDVPVVKPAPKSFDDEVADLARKLNEAAQA
jgi:hypothetical protein